MYTDEDLLPLSGIQHLAFCERQWALIHVESTWDENLDTTVGHSFHERAHEDGAHFDHGVLTMRSMRLVSYELGITGFSDVVEFVPCEDGSLRVAGSDARYRICPVEYKKGRPKKGDCDRVQLTAQALCLEEMYGVRIGEGHLFYGEPRRRERVEITDDLRVATRRLCERMHELARDKVTPAPVPTAGCKRCSLKEACIPQLGGRSAKGYWSDAGIAWG
jgi:CRISPR-associated exonuclease Cas4